MSDKALLITAIFKVLNFAIFIALCWYYIHKKVLAQLYQKMRERQAIIPNLEHERRGLQNQEANIETAIAQQALIAKVLQKKIEGWATTHNKQMREQEENNHHLQRLLEQKIEQQEDYRAKKEAYHHAVPKIIASTKEILTQHYQDPARAQAYIDTLFQHLKDNA